MSGYAPFGMTMSSFISDVTNHWYIDNGLINPEWYPERIIVGTLPNCDGDVVLKEGKYKTLVWCTNYPVCTYMRKANSEEKNQKGYK